MAKFRQQTDSHQKLVLASEVTRQIRRTLDAIVGAAGVQDEVRTEALEAVMMAMDAVSSQPRRPGQHVKDTHLLAIVVAGVESGLIEPEVLVDLTGLNTEAEEEEQEPVSTAHLMALQVLVASHPAPGTRAKAATQLARLAVALAAAAVNRAGEYEGPRVGLLGLRGQVRRLAETLDEVTPEEDPCNLGEMVSSEKTPNIWGGHQLLTPVQGRLPLSPSSLESSVPSTSAEAGRLRQERRKRMSMPNTPFEQDRSGESHSTRRKLFSEYTGVEETGCRPSSMQHGSTAKSDEAPPGQVNLPESPLILIDIVLSYRVQWRPVRGTPRRQTTRPSRSR